MRQQQWQLLLHFHPATCSMSVAAVAAADCALFRFSERGDDGRGFSGTAWCDAGKFVCQRRSHHRHLVGGIAGAKAVIRAPDLATFSTDFARILAGDRPPEKCMTMRARSHRICPTGLP